MSIKTYGIFGLILLMLIAPTTAGIIAEGQASDGFFIGKGDVDIPDREVTLYVSATGEVEKMDFEEYICCVMLAEVPAYFEQEALKAMAVAIRSYCARRMERERKDMSHFSADMCDDYTHCLGYISYEDACKRWGDSNADEYYKKIKSAVEQTKGMVLFYEGEIIDALFYSNTSGYTESAKNVWGVDVPYLVSVESPEEAEKSEVRVKFEDFSDILEKNGLFCDLYFEPDEWVEKSVLSKSGRVEKLYIGGKVITGRRAREIFGLASTCFQVSFENGEFVFSVKGSGHGVGMSQYGCQAYALDKMEYSDILLHYYPNTKIGIWVQ